MPFRGRWPMFLFCLVVEVSAAVLSFGCSLHIYRRFSLQCSSSLSSISQPPDGNTTVLRSQCLSSHHLLKTFITSCDVPTPIPNKRPGILDAVCIQDAVCMKYSHNLNSLLREKKNPETWKPVRGNAKRVTEA